MAARRSWARVAVRLAAAEEPAVAERAAEREPGGLELLRGRLAD